ncbi:MAG: AsmA-like C-terminal region-containing protein, partial [Pseudomonadota bacterium]
VLLAEALAWAKPRGAPATAKIEASFTESGADIREIVLSGDDVDIEGAIRFSYNGRIERADFDRFRLGETADLALRASRSADDALELSLLGRRLDMGPLFETLFASEAAAANSGGENGEIDWGPGLRLKTRIETIVLRNGVAYNDADIDFWRDPIRIQIFDVSARDDHGDLLSVGLAHTGADTGPRQTIEARTDDIGALLSGIFGLQSVVGGQGVVDLFVQTDDEKRDAVAGFSGDLEARNLRIVGAPLLARIFAAGSLDGLGDLLRGEGIMITQGFADFAVRDGVLFLRDLRAAGPSVGLTADGRIAADASGGIDLNGAVAPVYQVNSFLGRAPIVGDLFVNRDGEGVVALSYQVKGPATAPTVSVNPLSALTPGFLRRIFEPERKTIDEMMEEDIQEEDATPQ